MMPKSAQRPCPELWFLLFALMSTPVWGSEPPPSPTVSLTAHPSVTELLVGEPLELEVVLRWEDPVAGTALVTAATFLEIEVYRDGVRVEKSIHAHDVEYTTSISSWEKEMVFLSIKNPEWHTTYEAPYSLPLSLPGTYEIAARWQSEPLNTEARERISKLFRNHQLIFLTELNQEASATTVITCPKNEVDRRFYLQATGSECPEGNMVWPFYLHPPNKPDTLLDTYPESTYAAYILKNRVPGYTGWEYKTDPPKEFTQAAIADGPVKEFSPKWERVFKLVEINLQSGNTPQPLRSRFWMYYGERLLLKGRMTEAKEAFEKAVKSSMREDSVYVTRSKGFLEVLEDL